ncbi:MAG TPA: cytochrome c oxidase accessory protein CcoG [Vicinamibacterales bacterium]|nr:cytochrome c oxidase accessory protein CcoG [Vicinamibacterales bacterium]
MTTSARGFDEDHETFRNALASVQADGRRKWVYARQPSGRYYRARTVLSWFLLAFLFSAPFIRMNGQQLILLDFIERRFVAFGLVFWPQDFYIAVLVALTALVTLALVTTTVGRIWCGWLCPQTVFMEMLFRKIEYLIDGTAAQQVRRDNAPWTFDTAWRRVVKHGVFFGLSFVIANVFLAYIIGADELRTIVTDPPRQHLAGLIAITIFSLVFYGVFARFREQACTLACPYGRVMSALTDRHTLTVTYDRRRGEPRGRRLHAVDAAATPHGDCVDCAQCVTVCPTGIDIRNGIQLECINCTACMDACDDVMRRLSRPAGLIRITSHEAVETGVTRVFTPRVKAYASIWTVMVTAVLTLIITRPDVDVLILRQPGTLYTAMANDMLGNFYTVQVINRTGRAHALEYRAVTPAGASITALGDIGAATPHGLIESRFLLSVPAAQLTGASTPVTFAILVDGQPAQTVASSFLGPGGPAPAKDGR